jgi:hypothetical protein
MMADIAFRSKYQQKLGRKRNVYTPPIHKFIVLTIQNAEHIFATPRIPLMDVDEEM